MRLAVWLGIAAASAGFLLVLWLRDEASCIYSRGGWASTIAIILFMGVCSL